MEETKITFSICNILQRSSNMIYINFSTFTFNLIKGHSWTNHCCFLSDNVREEKVETSEDGQKSSSRNRKFSKKFSLCRVYFLWNKSLLLWDKDGIKFNCLISSNTPTGSLVPVFPEVSSWGLYLLSSLLFYFL